MRDAEVASAPEAEGSLVLQLGAPVEKCPALSACFHWEALRKMGAVLGDAVLVVPIPGGQEISGSSHSLMLRAWASPRVGPTRVALTDEARAAIGPAPNGVRVCTLPRASIEATRVELEPVPSDLQETPALGGQLDAVIRAQLLGAYVGTGSVVPVRVHGLPLTLRVLRVDGGGENSPPSSNATATTRLSGPLSPPPLLHTPASNTSDDTLTSHSVHALKGSAAHTVPWLVGTLTLLTLAQPRASRSLSPGDATGRQAPEDTYTPERGVSEERTVLSDVA